MEKNYQIEDAELGTITWKVNAKFYSWHPKQGRLLQRVDLRTLQVRFPRRFEKDLLVVELLCLCTLAFQRKCALK